MVSPKLVVCRKSGQIASEAVLSSVKIADTFLARLIGLLSRSGIRVDEGLLITPCASIHTFFMRFTIDVIFLDKTNKVLGFSCSVRPNKVRFAPRGTHSVLEVAEGNVIRTGIHLDDILIFD